MAVAASRARSWMLIAAALAAVYVAVFAIVGSAAFARKPDVLAIGVTFDLTITATFAVWWLGVRRRTVSPWIAFAVLSWGVAVARRWVPHAPIGALFAIGGALEVVTLGWLAIRIRRIARGARAARDEGPIGAIEAGLRGARFPARVAAILATELAVVGLVVTGWFRKPAPGSFAMRSTGWLSIAGVFGFLIVVESVAVHLLVAMWSPLVAWILSASSAYMLLWLVGDAHAIRLYPVAITGPTLRLRLGIRWRGSVALADIVTLEERRTVPEGALNLALIEPTVLLTLRQPVTLYGLLGKQRRGDRVALTIDDPKALISAVTAAVTAAMNASQPSPPAA